MTSSSPELTKCPVCEEPAAGRFCANCGAALAKISCTECGAPLSPGALFCHRCGKRVGRGSEVPAPQEPSAVTPARKEKQSLIPWAVAALALLAAFATLAGRGFNASRGSTLDAPQNALPQGGMDDRGAAVAGPNMRGPDISAMSPQERASRLYTRVMILNSEGKKDSVQFFAPMALVAYQMLEPLNADQRYDMGRIAEVAGQLDVARAQADTILKSAPRHLLGLILAARAAELLAQPAQRADFTRRLLAAEQAEMATKKPEYERHEDDIKRAVAAARSAGTRQ